MSGVTPAPCPHRPPCPGCPRWGLAGPAPEQLDALAALAREAGAPDPVLLAGEPLGWRRRARLAVRGRANSPKLGIFREGSHDLVDVPRCLTHHPAINEAAQALRAAIRATGVAPYHEKADRGLLRYAQITAIPPESGADVEPGGTALQIVLVGNAEDPGALAPLAAPLRERLGDRLQGLFANANPGRTNAILGAEMLRLSGEEDFGARFGASRVRVPPGAFFQANPELFARAVERVQAAVPAGARVLELYAGVGTIGLGLAERASSLAMEEIAPAARTGLERGRAMLAPELRERVEILAVPAEDAAPRVAGAEIVIADPPRRGLDPGVLAALLTSPPRQLHLVACGFEAFLRDARALLAPGRLRLADLVALDLFPMSGHVEVLARFDRVEA
ncbi:MAG: hypothetical protein R3F20_11155 [Planctomycetota bacterium]